jgi:hypothetical protein
MRLSCKTTIAVITATVMLFAATRSVHAQGQGRRGFGGGEGIRLRVLALPKVQDELKLSAEIKAEVQKQADSLQGLYGGLQNLSQEERQQKFQEIQDKTKAAVEQVNKVLSKEQNERLDQIVLQARGTQALMDEKVSSELKMTDDQRQKLSQLQQQVMQQFRDAQGDQQKMAEIRKSSREQALAVLTDEQRKQFEKMQGAKIELPDNLFGGRRPQ